MGLNTQMPQKLSVALRAKVKMSLIRIKAKWLPLDGGSSISDGTISKETLEDSDLGVLAVLSASLSLTSLALPCERDFEPRLFLLPLRRSFNRDFLFGVFTGFSFFFSGSGKARLRLDREELLEGGLCSNKIIIIGNQRPYICINLL